MNTTVTIDPTVLQLIVAVVLPGLVALIAHRLASGAVKAVVLILLSVLAGWLTELQATGGSFELRPTVIAIVMTFAGAVVSHFGLLQPLRITGGDGVIQQTVPAGVGRPSVIQGEVV